ncbi:MAG: hypothetical protein ACLSH7_07700 [Veillonella parvula]
MRLKKRLRWPLCSYRGWFWGETTTVEIEANKVTPKAALLAMLNVDRAQKYPVFSKDIEITSVTVKDGIASVEVNDAFVKANGGD